MRLSDFSYELPDDRIARVPAEPRDSARMLVCSRGDPSRVEHARIRDLPRYLGPGDVLVLNETRVLPHRLLGRRASGARVECLILERSGPACVGFVRPARKLASGERVAMEGGALTLVVEERLDEGRCRFRLAAADGEDVDAVLERVGRAPLPPYLARPDRPEDPVLDRERYQCVFAREPGAVAAPTAGLHLTPTLLDSLAAAGVREARVVLHVGLGTFEPIRAEVVEEHVMHEEEWSLPEDAAARCDAARAGGGRVVCVGTTSVRVLESAYDPEADRLVPGRGRTRLFLHPGRGPRVVDVLLTNFHLPESSLLLLVASILGRDRTLELYRTAIAEGYRFFSFGDAMLILP
ncbi:MAG: tRNA preQ1(34) S-adenosylmethionine ribosyltransferase-isomerase QueA [Planctomycetota bacterium]